MAFCLKGKAMVMLPPVFHRLTSKLWEVGWEQTGTNMSAKVCNWSRVVDFLTTFSQLSHNFLTTFSQLSHNFLKTFSQLSHNFLSTFSQLSHYFLTTFSQLSHNFLTIFSQLSHNFLTTFSQHSHNFLTIFSQLSQTFSHFSHNFLDDLQLSWQTYNSLNIPWFVQFWPLSKWLYNRDLILLYWLLQFGFQSLYFCCS